MKPDSETVEKHCGKRMFSKDLLPSIFNPLPHVPILSSSSSAANKDMMSNILTTGDTIF